MSKQGQTDPNVVKSSNYETSNLLRANKKTKENKTMMMNLTNTVGGLSRSCKQ